MKNCEQTKGLTVLQHGESVRDYAFDLINHLRTGSALTKEWRLPDWVIENSDEILRSLPSDETMALYTVYHDIGKPFCLTVDDDGRRHFPNHAQVSYEVFSQAFDDSIAADLILHDMDVHLLKADDVEKFCENPNHIALLITGLSEIHSNCQMFGGIDSTSFKIKWKSINQRGKQIFNLKKQKTK